ncbi:DUF6221 family protein [Streptomyces mirabilis]|uniref:DUF6221 family protein n=1 Tax=Streptomyces mirabilis TaxID=68239 RepID=UPI0036AFBDEB
MTTLMDDLVRWLGEQLDEDERIAKMASAGPWTRHVGRITGGPEGRVLVAQQAQAWNADHIARHDPARVLREIEAKRRLLDDYTVTARIRDEAAARIKAAGDHPDPKDLETWDRAQREAAILEGPVRLAALPLADRPGYREEWRP